MAVTSIVARATVEGLHHWPGAHAERDYLAQPHRHLFRVEVTVPVAHDDRDVEFHDLKQAIDECLDALGGFARPALADFGAASCETLARALHRQLAERGIHASRIVWSEDGEFDAVLDFG